MKREEEYEYYQQPENQEPQGPPRSRKSKLNKIVPVRLEEETVEKIRQFAGAEGRSVGAWIRQAINRALSLAEARDADPTDATRWQDELTSLVLPFERRQIVVEPVRVLATQLFLVSEKTIDTVETTLRRALHAMSDEDLNRVFAVRTRYDDDLVLHRPRSYVPDFHGVLARQLRETQASIVRVAQLASTAEVVLSEATITELRTRVAATQELTRQAEDILLDTPKRGVSDVAEWGIVAFYSYLDVARDVLSFIDRQLFELCSTDLVIRAPKHPRQRRKA